MDQKPTLADYRWLISDQARPWLDRVVESHESLVQQTTALRKDLSPAQAHLVLEQAELRRRARAKFSQANMMFFTRRGLEQASGERMAEYKARRFQKNLPVADLCCGIGGDLLSLAQDNTVIGVDRCEISIVLAEGNSRLPGLQATSFLCQSVTVDSLTEVGQWHIDPNRRPTGPRVTRVEYAEPPVEEIDQLLQVNRHGAIKLAPAANVETRWPAAELEWISDGRECKQLVAWNGKLARFPGDHTATCVRKDGQTDTWTGKPRILLTEAPRIDDCIYEPDPAVLAADLVGDMAGSFGLKALTPHGGYLTGPLQSSHPLLHTYRVVEQWPFDVKCLKAALRSRKIGQLTIKKRGVDISPSQLATRLAPVGDEQGILFVLPYAGKTRAVLAQ